MLPGCERGRRDSPQISAKTPKARLVEVVYITQCCIDGNSRLLVYVHCTDNNRAETVLELFTQVTQEYGIPSRVRSEHGLENVGVVKFMLENRVTVVEA